MSIPQKQNITQIAENDIVAPSVANQPHIDLETNIDRIRTYLVESITDQFDYDPSLTSGLNFYVNRGRMRVNSSIISKSAGTVGLLANDVNYVQLNGQSHAIEAVSGGFSNNAVPLWIVTTDTTSITSVQDARSYFYSLPQGLSALDDVAFNSVTTQNINISSGNLSISGDFSALGNITLGDNPADTLIVGATTTFNNGVILEHDVTIGSSVADTFTVNADSVYNGAVSMNAAVAINNQLNVGQDLVVAGDLIVNGTTTTVNSTTMSVDDPVITLGGVSPPTSNDAKDRGVEFNYYDTGVGAKKGFFGWDENLKRFVFIGHAVNVGEVFSPAVADQFGDATFNSIAFRAPQGTAPMDVVSSTLVANLNADLLDGQDGSYYLDYNNFINTPNNTGTETLALEAGRYPTAGVMAIASMAADEWAGGTFVSTPKLKVPDTVQYRGRDITYSDGTIRVYFRISAQDAISSSNWRIVHNGSTVYNTDIPNNSASPDTGTGNYIVYPYPRTDGGYSYATNPKYGYVDINVSPGDEIWAEVNTGNNNGSSTEIWFGLSENSVDVDVVSSSLNYTPVGDIPVDINSFVYINYPVYPFAVSVSYIGSETNYYNSETELGLTNGTSPFFPNNSIDMIRTYISYTNNTADGVGDRYLLTADKV